ncbi:Tim44 domain-containing protein [Rhizobiales bacterium]|uniref:Tim44 domain-containing protein n=1 Tax=Hongsoonwoonella zoysiae TaxID=2821844 RepID=UPI0015611DDB|nr:Tim44 domain-containing protein [Hongsoonwoonella zoysiae]NRG17612.1 Tim44 domain-containing protein [Hongsoonwoonella zoysiae]
MKLIYRFRAVFLLLALATTLSLIAADYAEARRGFSFGGRGLRTFSVPKATPTAPRRAQPLQNTQTPRQGTSPSLAARQNPATSPRRGLFGGGFFGSMMGGLLLGGLIGMLLGHGIGGFAGMLGLLLQLAIIGGIIMFFMRRRQPEPQPAYAPAGLASSRLSQFSGQRENGGSSGFKVPDIGGTPASSAASSTPFSEGDEIGITPEDLDTFEKLLTDIQEAFGREDYTTLRGLSTTEAFGFLAEDLGKAASAGLVNEVRDIKLLQGDLSEAWREGAQDYATVAMRYTSIDVTRDRATNRVVEGDPDTPSEVTELWTFVRENGGNWRLSAIQQAG